MIHRPHGQYAGVIDITIAVTVFIESAIACSKHDHRASALSPLPERSTRIPCSLSAAWVTVAFPAALPPTERVLPQEKSSMFQNEYVGRMR